MDTPRLIIAQVQITGGPDKTKQDFVQIYNPGSEKVNLKGIRLVKRTGKATKDTQLKYWSTDTWIEPGATYTWANSEVKSKDIKVNTTSSGSLAENNGVALRLGDLDAGTLIDSISWGQTTNTFPIVVSVNPKAGEVLKRQDLNGETSAYFIQAIMPSPSPLPKGEEKAKTTKPKAAPKTTKPKTVTKPKTTAKAAESKKVADLKNQVSDLQSQITATKERATEGQNVAVAGDASANTLTLKPVNSLTHIKDINDRMHDSWPWFALSVTCIVVFALLARKVYKTK